MKIPRHQEPLPRTERGAVLIVAMLLSAVIGVSLASYIRLGSNAMEISNRALLNTAAMNLAETGLEEAIWALNKAIDEDPNAWDDWTVEASDNNVTRGWSGYDLGANATGEIRVFVESYDGVGGAPVIVARATVQPARGPALDKWVEVTLVRRSLFANGLTARNQLTFSGQVEVDSYDSRLGAYDAALASGGTNRYDRGRAASISTEADALSSGQGDIWGFVAIGTPDFSGLDVGSKGLIGPYGTAAGTVVAENVTTDFTADFPNAENPSPIIVNAAPASWATLPHVGALADTDGKYYYVLGPTDDIALAGSSVMNITDDVVLRFTATSGTVLSVSGNGAIVIAPTDASLHIYTEADIAIAGNGISNPGSPEDFQIWGTRADTAPPVQSISIAGNGQLNSVVYAPNASVTVNGGGSSGQVSGAVVANNITLTGGSEFHYDEALADMTDGNPYGLGAWRELNTSAARAAYAADLAFSIP